MSFLHGSSTRVLVNEIEVSSEVAGWAAGWNRQMSEVTCVGQTAGNAAASFVPGLSSGTLALRGPQSTVAAAGLQQEIVQAIGVDNAFQATCLPDGVAIGKPAYSMIGDPSDYAVDAQVADAVAMTSTSQVDESLDFGFIVAALQAYTADALTGTAVDRGAFNSVVAGTPTASSARGLAGFVHVTAYSGFTGVAVKIQHSADNSSWSDLATFTNITAVGAQRVLVANGTTVNRYLRSSIDVTGSGSVTMLVTAAPR